MDETRSASSVVLDRWNDTRVRPPRLAAVMPAAARSAVGSLRVATLTMALSPSGRSMALLYYTTLDDLVRNLSDAEATGRFRKKLQTYLIRE